MIEHDNIVYVRNINPIGGVETYAYELIKKYHDKDIAVVCKSIAPEQRIRFQKYCRVYEHTSEKIKCKVAIINWDTSIIDYITKDIWKENAKDGEGVYQGIHADYTHPSQGTIPEDDRIKYYLAITEDVKKNFIKMTGRKNVIVCRNPLEIEKDKKSLILVSPTRLTPEKGGDLMLKLANALDSVGIEFLWFIPTLEQYLDNPIFSHPNVIYVKNRLDVEKFINIADWVVLPSETEGDSYSFKEALYRGVPIVVRKLPYFKEIGIKDKENALFINEENIEEVAKAMEKPLKFTFEPIKDGYDKILAKGKSKYAKDLKTKVKVRCIKGYKDLDLNKQIKVGDEFEINIIRWDYLKKFKELERID